MAEFKTVNLFDWSGGIVNKRTNPMAYPENALWDGTNVDVSDKWLKTRLGTSKCTAAPIVADSVVERVYQVRFPTTGASYIVAQTRTSTASKLWVSDESLPTATLSFAELYDLGLTAGEVSCAVLNDRAVFTEGVVNRPLVFLGGLTSSGADWAFPKQIFATLDGSNFFNMTSQLCDNDVDSYVELPDIPSAGGIYVCFDVPTTTGVYFGVKTAGTTICTTIVERYVNGTWTNVSITDGTVTAGVPLAKSGTITWTAIATDYQAIAEVAGYWIRIRFDLDIEADETKTATIDNIDDITTPSYLGTIVNWNKASSKLGRFETGGGVAVAVGSGTDVLVGSLVTFADTTTATIISITSDGTGASGVALSSDHEDGAITSITRAIVELVDIKGTIASWVKVASTTGYFLDGAGLEVTVGTITDILEGATVLFSDAASVTISDIPDPYVSGTSRVTLSADHITGTITSIKKYYRLMPNYDTGANGTGNTSTTYSTAIMTAPALPSPNVVTTSNEVVYLGWKAFDQISDYNGWVSTADTGWIKIDLGTAKIINKYMLQARNIVGGTGFPSAWTLQGSNNDSTWTTVDGQTSITDPGTSAWNTYEFTSLGTAYRYYKVVVTAKNAGTLAIGEIRLIEAYNVAPTQLAVGTTTSATQVDVTELDSITAVVVDSSLPAGSYIYHAVSWDARNTWYVYLSSTWRIIAQKDVLTWKYADGTAMIAATVNSMLGALRQAFGETENQWNETAVEAMGLTQWMGTGGFSGDYTTMDFAFGMLSSAAGVPELAGYEIQGSGYTGVPWLITAESQLDRLSVENGITYWRKCPLEWESGVFWSDGVTISNPYWWDTRGSEWVAGGSYGVGSIVLRKVTQIFHTVGNVWVPLSLITPQYIPWICVAARSAISTSFYDAANYVANLAMTTPTGNQVQSSGYFSPSTPYYSYDPYGSGESTYNLKWQMLEPTYLAFESSAYLPVGVGVDFQIVGAVSYGVLVISTSGVTQTGTTNTHVVIPENLFPYSYSNPSPAYGFNGARFRYKTTLRIKPGTQYTGCFMGDEHFFAAVDITSESIAGAEWTADTVMSMGDIRLPVTPNGYRYEVTARAGDFKTAPVIEPVWPTTVDDTVVDDQITWTCKGGTKTGFPFTAHNLDPGDQVYLYNFTGDYNRIYEVDADTTADNIIIIAPYVAETMTTSCAWRQVITLGTGYEADYVKEGCKVTFDDDNESLIIIIRGDGADLDDGVRLGDTVSSGTVSSIDTIEYYSGKVRPITKQVLLPASAHGNDNINTGYATQVMTAWHTPTSSVCAAGTSFSPESAEYYGLQAWKVWTQSQTQDLQLYCGHTVSNSKAYYAYSFDTPKAINKYDMRSSLNSSPRWGLATWKLYGYDAVLTSKQMIALPSGAIELHSVVGYSDFGESSPHDPMWLGQEGQEGGYFTFENTDSYYTYILECIDTSTGYGVDLYDIKLVEAGEATATYTPEGTFGTMAVAAKQIDTSSWSSINSCVVVSKAEKLTKVAFAFSFDNLATFKCYRGGWRSIVRENVGVWQYNSGAGSTTWSNADVDTLKGALLQALDNPYNYTDALSTQNMDASQWQATGGFSGSINTLDVLLVFKTDPPYAPNFTKIIFNTGTTVTTTCEFTNASTDISQDDIKGTIANWVVYAGDATRGHFTTSLGVAVTLGAGKTNTDVEVGNVVYFSDGTDQTILKIIGDGSADGAVILDDETTSLAVASIKRIFWDTDTLTISYYADLDGTNNSTTYPINPPMTSANTPSPYVVSESTYSTYPAWKAWDQTTADSSDCWKTSPGITEASTVYDYGVGIVHAINKYALKCINDATGSGFPSAWKLYSSNDNVSWTLLDTRTAIASPGSNTWTSYYTFTNGINYRYYKLAISASNGTWIELGDIKLVDAQSVVCADYAYVLPATSLRLTPTTGFLATGLDLLALAPGASSFYAMVSFDAQVTWKVYSAGWKSSVRNNSGTWQYNSTLSGTATWVNSTVNTFFGAFSQATVPMTLATLEALTTAHWQGTGGFTSGATVDVAYKLLADGANVPYVTTLTLDATRPAESIDAAVSKLSYQAPCQALANIAPTGAWDICVGFVVQTSTGSVKDYSVEVADGSLNTGADLNALGVADFLYIGGVEQFFALKLSITNELFNDNEAVLSGDYWNGTTWVAASITDGTTTSSKTLYKSGVVTWGQPLDWRENDPVPGTTFMAFWMRFQITAVLSANVQVREARLTTKPTALAKYKYAVSFANRLALMNRPDQKCQVEISRPFEEFGFTGETSMSILVGGGDEIVASVKSYDQLWITKLDDWYQITSSSLSSLESPRGEAANQTPLNDKSIVLAPIDKYGKSVISPVADQVNRQGIYFINHNGGWCFTGSELYRIGEWVTWWDKDAVNPRLDTDYLHKSGCCFWAYRNWIIWTVPMISGAGTSQTTCNRLLIYDATNGVWETPFNISAACLCQAKVAKATAPGGVGETILLAGGQDGYIYQVFDPEATTDSGATIASSVETGWLSFDAPNLEKILRTAQIFGSITTGDLTLQVRIDGEETTDTLRTFTISSLSLSPDKAYVLDFSHRNITANMFKFILSWSGPGSIYGCQLEVGAVRGWPTTTE